MLKFSKKIDYAIILLVHLAKSENPVSAQEVSLEYELPAAMVANLFKSLSSGGLVESKRGQQGGYLLTKSPEKISISEVIEVVDKPFFLVECASNVECGVYHKCPTKTPLILLHQELNDFLEKFTLDRITQHNEACCDTH